MKKSAVNRHIFVRDIKRSWPVWVGMSLLYFLILIPTFITRYKLYALNPSNDAYMNSVSMSLDMIAVFAALADLLLVLIVFGFANNTRSANFFFSLPIKRGALFVTKLLSCVTATFVPALLAGITIVAYSGGHREAWLLAGNLLMAHASFLGMALLFMSLIGQSVAYAAISVILQFVPIMLIQLSTNLLRMTLYGYSPQSVSGLFYRVVFPVNHFITARTYWDDLGNKDSIIVGIILAAFGILCAVLAYFAFKRRRAESAGDIIAFKRLRPLFKYGVTVCSATLLTYVMFSSFGVSNVTPKTLPAVCLMIVLSAGLGYFISEMLIQKRFNVFKRSMAGFIVSSAVLVCVACCAEFDILGVETRVPDADEVEWVYISSSAEHFEPEDIEKVLAFHRFLTEQKDISESFDSDMEPAVVSAGSFDIAPLIYYHNPDQYFDSLVANPNYGGEFTTNFMRSHYPNNIYIRYMLKNGKSLYRTYYPTTLFCDQNATEEYGRLFYALARTYAYTQYKIFGDIGNEIGDKTIAAVADGETSTKLGHERTVLLYDAIQKDIRDMNLGVDYVAPPTAGRPETIMETEIHFIEERGGAYYYEQYGYDYGDPKAVQTTKEILWYLTLDTRAANTLALLEDWGIEVRQVNVAISTGAH